MPPKPQAKSSPSVEHTESNFNQLLSEILDFKIDDQTDFLELVAFSGFDPIDIFKMIAPKLLDAKGRMLLQYAITFGLTRGFGGGKTFQTLEERTNTANGKAKLREARALFNIVITANKTKDDVTFDRLMAAFPSVTHKVWLLICNRSDCPEKYPDYDGELPTELQYPGAPAAMDEATKNMYFDEYINWMIGLQKIWGKNGNIRGGAQDRDTVVKFAELQYATKLFPMKNRPNHTDK